MPAGTTRVSVVARHVLQAGSVSAQTDVGDYPPGTYFGCKPDYEHPIVMPKTGYFSEKECPPRTFPDILGLAAKNFPEFVALAAEKPVPAPKGPGDAPSLPWVQWKKWTWAQYWKDVRSAAKAFTHFGVEQFGSVSIFGFNSPEWLISAVGAMLCGGKYVGIYSTDTPEQFAYKVCHSGSAVVVVDGEVEFNAAASKIDEIPTLRAIVYWGVVPGGVAELKRADGSVVKVLQWDSFISVGEKPSDEALESVMQRMRPGHCGCVIYTSGTTGNPKAVMVHHDAMVVQGHMMFHPETGLLDAFAEEPEGRILSYLPLSHIAGGLMDILNPICCAGILEKPMTIYFARPYDLKEMTLAARIQFARPTAFLAVPRVFEKMQARMMAVGASITGIKKKLATWAKGKGLEYCRNKQLGGSRQEPWLHHLADKLILSKARDALGLDKCKVFLTGAAPIAVETLEYFGQLGMIIQNCYGMSESSGATTLCSPMRNVFGTVGHAWPSLEVKCFKMGPSGENIEVPPCKPGQKNLKENEQGELCYRGRHIMMGYMGNPAFGEDHIQDITEKNRSTIDQWGWLHSGDKGCIDTNGMARITGRYKELIIGAGGENIAPVPVEEHIKLHAPAVSNVMMVGDNRKYNVAVVTLQAVGSTGEFPGTDELMPVGLEVSPQVKTISVAMKDPKWKTYVQNAITKTNDNPVVCQNNAWKVQKFVILPRDFSIQTGELTATLKLRRSVAEEIWKDAIDGLYAD